MGTNTLNTNFTDGDDILSSHVKQFANALNGDMVGRNLNAPSQGQSLGTPAIPWGSLYASSLVINGQSIDFSAFASLPNRIDSGKTRANSDAPDFLRAVSGLKAQILGDDTSLLLSINNSAVTINTDIEIDNLSTAPSTNNTALVNGTFLNTDTEINIDTLGSNVSSLVGEVVAFKTDDDEIFIGKLESATLITNVKRGWFLDSSGEQLDVSDLADNDTLTVMRLGWVFVENDATTTDVSYTTPVVAYTSPENPTSGDYWFDVQNATWKRYSGTEWVTINRILIGQVVLNSTAIEGARPFDFSRAFSDVNNIGLKKDTDEIIKTQNLDNGISVYGNFLNLGEIDWNITNDLESGVSEENSTTYYLYLSSEGQAIISDKIPHHRPELRGYYHPVESWRCVGEVENDSEGNFVLGIANTQYPYNQNDPVSRRYSYYLTGGNVIARKYFKGRDPIQSFSGSRITLKPFFFTKQPVVHVSFEGPSGNRSVAIAGWSYDSDTGILTFDIDVSDVNISRTETRPLFLTIIGD